MNRRGQGLVETLLSLPLMIAVGIGLFNILYRSLVFHYADYQAHEALVCMQSESTHLCQSELEERLKKILLPMASSETRLKKTLKTSKIKVSIFLNQGPELLNVPIEINKTL